MAKTLTADALSETEPLVNIKQLPINVTIVSNLEKHLDIMEKVSLVFLLYDDVEMALQHLIQLQHGVVLEVVALWCSSLEKRGCQWQGKLLEAFTLIQNFSIINKLGYSKKEVCARFLPYNSETSLFVDLYKKKLYCICEKMSNDQMYKFLTRVQDDFQCKKLKYQEFLVPYMEMYYLHWTIIKYISPTDLSNLSKIFKTMEMFDVSESLLYKQPLRLLTNVEGAENNSNSRINNNDGPCSSITSETSSGSVYQDCTWTTNYENNCYYIDPKSPGICLIINQESFYREPDRTLSHILPSHFFKLDRRKGTIFDRDRLKITFEALGYDVKIENNLTHKEILEAVTVVVNKIRHHSSLIICILSHGIEGKVFGVNSIPVNISEIRDIVCSVNITNLRNKPKILILQSCQGTECQTVSDDEDDEFMEKRNKLIQNTCINFSIQSKQEDSNSDLQMDGGSRPKTADVLLFWATVPGFGAVRDTLKGSWFIQSLCKHIQEKANRMHFEDICTLVKQEVIDKRWKTKEMLRVMVPIKESTLSRFFYLPSFKPPAYSNSVTFK